MFPVLGKTRDDIIAQIVLIIRSRLVQLKRACSGITVVHTSCIGPYPQDILAILKNACN
jgi:hypothetical protein